MNYSRFPRICTMDKKPKFLAHKNPTPANYNCKRASKTSIYCLLGKVLDKGQGLLGLRYCGRYNSRL